MDKRKLNTGSPPGAAPINTARDALCLCFGCNFCANAVHGVQTYGPSKTGNQLCDQCEQAILEGNIAWDDDARIEEDEARSLSAKLNALREKKVVDLTEEEIDLFLTHPSWLRIRRDPLT